MFTVKHKKMRLIYPSDFGYATSGGKTSDREICLQTELYNWFNYEDCYKNSWLYYEKNNSWTMTPRAFKERGYDVFSIAKIRRVGGLFIDDPAYATFPVVFLNSEVKIISGTGEESNPFALE